MINKHMKRYLMFLLLGLVALMSIYAAVEEYSGLDVVWSFSAGNETFSVGFTDRQPAVGLNVGWNDISNSTQVKMKDLIQNSATFHKAKGRVYAYWNFFSNESITVTLGSTGPLTVSGGDDKNNTNKINWTASWTPMSVNSNGDIIELSGQSVSIGRNDNIFSSSNNDYSPKIVFNQVADNYPLKSKYGYARIDIETQDTKSSDITGVQQKIKGNYTTSLILDVTAK